MASFFIALVTGVAAGAVTARSIVRRELDRYAREAAQRAAATPPVALSPVLAVAPAVVAPAPAPVAATVPVAAPAKVPIAVQEEITPEILMVLTAAVAAFLGKRARIRSARLSSPRTDSAWAQQGRVFVQASHNFPLSHR